MSSVSPWFSSKEIYTCYVNDSKDDLTSIQKYNKDFHILLPIGLDLWYLSQKSAEASVFGHPNLDFSICKGMFLCLPKTGQELRKSFTLKP
jgi:hypothetical protein